MALAWLVFPLVLGALALGCGLLLERAAGRRLPCALLLPAGFTVLVVAGVFATMTGATAELAAPLVVTLALLGFGLAFPWRLGRVDPWAAAAAVATFAAFGAPAVLTGEATFLGYIKLDDTATYLAMLDRAMEHGYDVSGLPPSTYEATLATSLAYGYPLGALVPLGVGSVLVAEDPAWLWQPYLSFLAVLLALALYGLFSPVVRRRPLRAGIGFLGAQAALLYGFAMWGGIKELATAAVLALAAALAPLTIRGRSVRGLAPLAVSFAALAAVLSLAGIVWLVPLVGGVALVAFRASGWRTAAWSVAVLAALSAVLAIPSLVAAVDWLPRADTFTRGDGYANLLRRLSWLQVFGIWTNGDFRVPARDMDATYALVAVAGVAALMGVAASLRERAVGAPLALVTLAFGCAVYVGAGSPWIGAKALASTSPIVLATALAGSAFAFERGRRVEAGVAALLVGGGVLWSNALQYHQVYVAPRERLAELELIGERFARQGPTLLTEFEPYAARHFLREMDPEAASELRRHFVTLRSGGVAETGVSPDIDEIRLADVLNYRTLVLRRSGTASRPPSVYAPVWRGRYYDVWQRPQRPAPILEHLSLGSRFQPAAVPPCGEVLRLARLAAERGGELAAVVREPALVIGADGSLGEPISLDRYGEDPRAVGLTRKASLRLSFVAPASGSYGVWVAGSFRSRLEASVDGAPVGSARRQLQWPGTVFHLGDVRVERGSHVLRLDYSGPDLRPGSAGPPPFRLGPIALARGTSLRPVARIRPEDARSLCGKSLDWLEAVGRLQAPLQNE